MSNFTRLTPINACKVIQVIEVKSIVGKGEDGDPIREIIEYYSFDGIRLARKERDDNTSEFGIWSEE